MKAELTLGVTGITREAARAILLLAADLLNDAMVESVDIQLTPEEPE